MPKLKDLMVSKKLKEYRKNPPLAKIGGATVVDAGKIIKEFMKDPDFKKGVELEKRKLEMAIKINQLRKKKKMSQAALAKKVGMKQSAIGRIEAGNQNLTLETLHRIADALQCKLEVKLG